VELWLQALQQQTLPHEGVEGTGVYIREVWAGKKLPMGLQRGVDVP
jgi:small subunit ribosomal protein S5